LSEAAALQGKAGGTGCAHPQEEKASWRPKSSPFPPTPQTYDKATENKTIIMD